MSRTPHRSAAALLGALFLAALAAPILAGCSNYHVVRTDASLGPVKRVLVQTLENQSFEPGIEIMVSDAFRREFQRGGGIAVVGDPAQADLVLSGIVTDLMTTPRSFSSVAFGLEYQVEMRLILRAQRADGTVIPLAGSALHDWEVYLTSADPEAERKNRDEALRRLSNVLAERTRDYLSARLTR
jgi:hypothetical protein